MKTKLLLLATSIVVISCSKMENQKPGDSRLEVYNHPMSLSTNTADFVHLATLQPSTINGHTLQATGFDKNGNEAYVVYNTQGEPVRGGIDIVNLSNYQAPTLKHSIVSEDREFAQVKYKDNHLVVAGKSKALKEIMVF